MKRNITTIATVFVTLVWLAALVAWHLYDPSASLTENVPGADHRPAGTERKVDDVLIGEFFRATPPQSSPTGEGTEKSPSSIANGKTNSNTPSPVGEGWGGVWPGFRGALRNNICTESVCLSDDDFSTEWTVETGEGHAAAVVGQGRVFVLDYDEQLSSDALRCFDLQSGAELWRRWYRVPMKRNHGFSRTIPALWENMVITIGPEGHVMCCDQESGELRWTKDMKKEFGSEIPFWYTGQCPLVEDGVLVLAPAGTETLLCGVDMKTGETLWQTPNEPGFKMSHSSVMPMRLGGKHQFVYIGVGGTCGVSAEVADAGRLLWSCSKWQPSVVAPSPLQLSQNEVFLVAGYGAGGAVLRVENAGGQWKADISDAYKADKGMSCEQQTPILFDNQLITILPKDGGGMRERIALYNPSNLHQPIWTSASDERFGLGPFMVLDDKLLAFKEDGELYVYHIGKGTLTLLRKQRVMEDGVDAWGPMAYADGRLLLRDAKHIVCLRIAD